MNFIEIQINNWEKYNPRTDRKGHTWFRLENTFSSDPKLHGLQPVEKLLWVCILAEVSKNKGEPTKIYLPWACDLTQASEPAIISAIKYLDKVGALTVTIDADMVTTGDRTVTDGRIRTDGRTDVRQVPNGTSPDRLKPQGAKTFRISTHLEYAKELHDFIPRWSALYPDADFHVREVLKALTWLEANPKKALKSRRGWVAFFGGWFERSWDRHQTRGPSAKPRENDWAFLAQRILITVRSAAPDERKLRLGDPDLYALACKVGWHNIGQMPNNDFSIKTLAGQLRAAYENQRQQQPLEGT